MLLLQTFFRRYKRMQVNGQFAQFFFVQATLSRHKTLKVYYVRVILLLKREQTLVRLQVLQCSDEQRLVAATAQCSKLLRQPAAFALYHRVRACEVRDITAYAADRTLSNKKG